MSACHAEYWLLKEVSSLEGYGTEIFSGRCRMNSPCSVAVSPQGITISNLESEENLRYVLLKGLIYIYRPVSN